MTDSKFYSITSIYCRRANALHMVEAVLSMYVMILFCVLFRLEWWITHPMACLFVSFIYVFYLASVENSSHGVGIFCDRLKRIRDFAGYCETRRFATNKTPFNDGDYLALSNNDYLRLEFVLRRVSQFDPNRIYHIRFSLKDGEKTKYEVQGNDYDYMTLMGELNTKIQEDGIEVEAIYNKFGDLKWKIGNSYKERSWFSRLLPSIYIYVWGIIQLAVSAFPVIFMLYESYV